MPNFKITLSPPDGSGDIIEKTIFISEQDFLKKFASELYESNFLIHEVKEVPSVFDKQVIQAKLDSGRVVNLLKFSFHLTYGDMIEGEPDENLNRLILRGLQTKFKPDYIPTYIRKLSEDKVKGELPVFYGVAEWASYKKIHEQGQPSELRVIWFMDEVPQGLLFRKMLQDSLTGLDWDQFAEEYNPEDL